MRNVLAAIASIALLAGCAAESTTTNDSSATASARASENRVNSANSAIQAREYDRAEATLNAELAANPNDPYANLTMGVLRAIQDRRDEAMAFYQRAAENGEDAALSQTVTANGVVTSESTTVAKVARENMSRLQ